MTPQDLATARLVLQNAEHSLRAATGKIAEHRELAEDAEDELSSRYHMQTAEYYWHAANELVHRINTLKQMLEAHHRH